MANKTEIKQIRLGSELYTCTLESVILANGTPGATWLVSARDRTGAQVTDSDIIDQLEALAR
ncbi:hypothetical protein MN032_17790 [Agromyces atrinae]|uniref:hypothetical protein n=1 Tax=Agromyces atrinae TaxID=592376 RepID=UPI001F5A93A8|nr:hypothetical protein [Agromyces atrinae]MCI2959541.1 hypothetical protein [Agromyces atrinae]